jgi:hypothetical protein
MYGMICLGIARVNRWVGVVMTDLNYAEQQQEEVTKYSSKDESRGFALFGYGAIGIGVILSIVLIVFLG